MRTRTPLAVILGLVLVATVQAPAIAKPVESETYEYHDTFNFRDCGLRLHGDDMGGGKLAVRAVKGTDEAFLGRNNYWYRFVMTNRDNGKWMVLRGNGTFHEMAATQIEGDIWEFTAKEAGQPFVAEDMTGAVLLRDRGMLEERAIFDLLGDGEPGGELLEQEFIHVAGPHPSFDVDFCDLVQDVIG
jgi:hypothetical protein